MTTLELARQVAELRGKQRLFFRIRSQVNRKKEAAELLIDCKRLEANLDRTVAGILDADPVLPPTVKPTQSPDTIRSWHESRGMKCPPDAGK